MADHDLDAPPTTTKDRDGLLVAQSATFTNMFEWPDADYKAKEDATFARMKSPIPAPDDHFGWRSWEQEKMRDGPKPVLAKRYRTAVKVNRTNVSVTYDGDNTYRILVHNPEPYPGEATSLRPAVLWFHGGGWAHGSPEMDAQRADYVASEIRGVVFNVDYRLIPEIAWPKNHNDVYHSIGWAIDNAKDYNIDPSRLAMWGQSAGAHLAAGAALRDAVEHKPSRLRHVNLTVPVTHDIRNEPYPLNQNAEAEMAKIPEVLFRQFLNVLRDMTGSDEPSTDPYFSPLRSEIPSHHPSTYISVGGLDRLRDRGIAYALHLRQHGVDTQLEIVPGVPHAYTGENDTYAAKQYWRDQVKVLNMALRFDWEH
ncbi:alpha/beta-hydrolase [Calocera viscosa TUFC12733]|uniref:Alpha/beta-hydrolase n=1 Tax=Calocera viscosa (strain TUFC12733) TaxID=1330018 RepID=A0A167H3H5_CALVF|nr:alpha/beta-hydrolase [Calocera viscosa TUFC12733]